MIDDAEFKAILSFARNRLRAVGTLAARLRRQAMTATGVRVLPENRSGLRINDMKRITCRA